MKSKVPSLPLSFSFSVSLSLFSYLAPHVQVHIYFLSPPTCCPHLILIIFLYELVTQNIPNISLLPSCLASSPGDSASRSSNFKISEEEIWSRHSLLGPCHRCLESHGWWDCSLDLIRDLLGSGLVIHPGQGQWERKIV